MRPHKPYTQEGAQPVEFQTSSALMAGDCEFSEQLTSHIPIAFDQGLTASDTGSLPHRSVSKSSSQDNGIRGSSSSSSVFGESSTFGEFITESDSFNSLIAHRGSPPALTLSTKKERKEWKEKEKEHIPFKVGQ